MPVKHLTSWQLAAVLEARGVSLPDGTVGQAVYLSLAEKADIKEVPLAELSRLRAPAKKETAKPPAAAPTTKASMYQSFDPSKASIGDSSVPATSGGSSGGSSKSSSSSGSSSRDSSSKRGGGSSSSVCSSTSGDGGGGGSASFRPTLPSYEQAEAAAASGPSAGRVPDSSAAAAHDDRPSASSPSAEGPYGAGLPRRPSAFAALSALVECGAAVTASSAAAAAPSARESDASRLLRIGAARLERLLLHRRDHVLLRCLSSWQRVTVEDTACGILHAALTQRFEEKVSLQENVGQLQQQLEEQTKSAASAMDSAMAKARGDVDDVVAAAVAEASEKHATALEKAATAAAADKAAAVAAATAEAEDAAKEALASPLKRAQVEAAEASEIAAVQARERQDLEAELEASRATTVTLHEELAIQSALAKEREVSLELADGRSRTCTWGGLQYTHPRTSDVLRIQMIVCLKRRTTNINPTLSLLPHARYTRQQP